MKKERTESWGIEDKAGWGAGPWVDEPDRVTWWEGDLPCLLRRAPLGVWCGYVGISEGHPLYERGYSDTVPELQERLEALLETPLVEMERTLSRNIAMLSGVTEPTPGLVLNAHGGLTFADFITDADLPDPSPWWFGFDCGHCDDLSPGYPRPYLGDTYRDRRYAEEDTRHLAHQLIALVEAS